MKRIWTRKDTAALQAAMKQHPAYLAKQKREQELAPVVDINTKERIQ